MISSPCKNCIRENLPKDTCAKNCKLLKAIQDIEVSSEKWTDGSGIDYTEEYNCSISLSVWSNAVFLWTTRWDAVSKIQDNRRFQPYRRSSFAQLKNPFFSPRREISRHNITWYMPVRKNHNNSNAAGRHKADTKISSAASAEIGQDAKKKNYLDMAALIRSIQRAEGQTDCFQKDLIDCDQADCKWHAFCLEGHSVLGKNET